MFNLVYYFSADFSCPLAFWAWHNMKAYECFPAELSAFTVLLCSFKLLALKKKHSNFLLIVSRKGFDKHLWALSLKFCYDRTVNQYSINNGTVTSWFGKLIF